MKKLIVFASLSVAGLILSSSQASAWWCHHCCHDNKCCTTICLRPYNAFTPVCCGNLSCNGCCPINMTQGCCGNGACGYGGYGYGGCGNGSCGPTCGGYAYGPTYGDGSYSLGQLPILDASQQGHAAVVGT
ncbi:MAG TPA: hypothetical protein VFA18_15650, partial [Gemmataceae bacterium]|nr:hypothetical protein [Gemmataceae bacterium]